VTFLLLGVRHEIPQTALAAQAEGKEPVVVAQGALPPGTVGGSILSGLDLYELLKTFAEEVLG